MLYLSQVPPRPLGSYTSDSVGLPQDVEVVVALENHIAVVPQPEAAVAAPSICLPVGIWLPTLDVECEVAVGLQEEPAHDLEVAAIMRQVGVACPDDGTPMGTNLSPAAVEHQVGVLLHGQLKAAVGRDEAARSIDNFPHSQHIGRG